MLRLFSAVFHFLHGYRCLRQSDHGGALFHFSKVIRANPRSYSAYHNRGIALQAMGTYASSVEDFDQAIRLNPQHTASYHARGISRKFLGDFDGAIEDHMRALALDPKHAGAYGELGVLYQSKGDVDRALIHLTTAIELAPRDPEGPKQRGYVQFYRGKFEAAATDLRRAIELGDDPYAMLFYYLARTRLTGAASELEMLAASVKGDLWPTPVFDLYLGRLPEQALLQAATTSHERAEALFYIGEWHLMKGDREAAIKALKAALQSLPIWFIEHSAAGAELARLG
jgi:lipoprotein NlpI